VPIDDTIEAFGQTYIEALISGVPSVFTLSGVASEFIENGKNALVVDYKNSEQISVAIDQILTNISYSSCQANLAFSQGSNFEYYTPGNPNTYGSYLPLYTPQISSSFAAFITNVVTPWYNNHPGTAGTATNFGYNMFSSTTYLSSTTSEVPGAFTPSLQNPYASDNVGDPGTLILTVSNIPTVTWGPSLKMLGRNYVGQYVHPFDGPLDAYFNSAFLPILGLSVSDPLSNPVNVPNAKFQAFYNVSL
jgi:hypothetical protein